MEWDVLWSCISACFAPFYAFFEPLQLTGISFASSSRSAGRCIFQQYGLIIAFFVYHALRRHDHVPRETLMATIRAHLHGQRAYTALIRRSVDISM